MNVRNVGAFWITRSKTGDGYLGMPEQNFHQLKRRVAGRTDNANSYHRECLNLKTTGKVDAEKGQHFRIVVGLSPQEDLLETKKFVLKRFVPLDWQPTLLFATFRLFPQSLT